MIKHHMFMKFIIIFFSLFQTFDKLHKTSISQLESWFSLLYKAIL
jgi:hypothetical protein